MTHSMSLEAWLTRGRTENYVPSGRFGPRGWGGQTRKVDDRCVSRSAAAVRKDVWTCTARSTQPPFEGLLSSTALNAPSMYNLFENWQS